MTHDRAERRARTVSLIGLVFQILLAAFYAILTVWSQSEAMRALTLLTAVGTWLWLTLVLIYHQRVRVQDESLDADMIRRERESGGASGAIFEGDEEQLFLARRRLRWMYRWFLPVATLIIFTLLVTASLARWSWGLTDAIGGTEWADVQHPEVLMWFLAGSALVCFLLSRYAVGMARYPDWRMLRAGATYLMGVTLASLALAITLGVIYFMRNPTPEHVLAYALRFLMLVLAAEFALNQMLDYYRPRGPDELPRPAFDSRLLGLFTEPGGIARSIAEAMNYQFGFEVSSTWFYKLLERSFVPLVGFAALSLLLASVLVFVDADQRAFIERFGDRLPGQLDPGLHVKWPWPIDRARMVSVERIHELRIGIKPETKDQKFKEELILWTNKHSQEPHLVVLVATPKLAEFMAAPSGSPNTRPEGDSRGPVPADAAPAVGGQAVPVSMLRVAMTLHYRIREQEAYDWLTRYEDPEGVIKAIANREILRYFASVDVNGVLGSQRGPIEKALWETLQRAADDAKLSVDLVFLGLQGVHPPEETAEAFQQVIGAEQKMTATVRTARADYNKKLSETAGDVRRAEELTEAIRLANRLDTAEGVSPAERRAARQRLDTLFFGTQDENIRPVGGDAMSTISKARAERWRLENQAHAKSVAFEQEIALKNVAPRAYQARKLLRTLAASVKGIRKYVVATAGQHSFETFHLDMKDPMNAPLDVALETEQ